MKRKGKYYKIGNFVHLKLTILSKMELLGLLLLHQGRHLKLKTPGSFMAQYWDSRCKIKKPKNAPRSPCLTLRTAWNLLWKARAGRTKPRAQRYSQTWAAQVENFTLCLPTAMGCTGLSHQFVPPVCSPVCSPVCPTALGEGCGVTCGAPGKSSAWGRGHSMWEPPWNCLGS